MLKAFGAFLLMFCVLSLLVQSTRMGDFFGGCGLVLFALDVLLSRYERERRDSRFRASVL